MARSYSQITSSVWRDADFRGLSMSAQWTYIMLITQADISSAGTLPMTERRWSSYAPDVTRDSLSDSLCELAEARFIAYDETTEELLVRSFVKWDGGSHNEKRRPAITAAANAVASPVIRRVLAAELNRLDVPHDLGDSLSDTPSDALSDTPRVVVTERSQEPQPTTLVPQPTTLVPATRRAAAARGRRLPPEWAPGANLVAWAREQNLPDEYCRRQTEKFVDYYTAQTGAKATKADWDATWRNWIRRAVEERPPAAAGTKSRQQQETDDLFERAARRMGVAQ
jgi:hypothetical protein